MSVHPVFASAVAASTCPPQFRKEFEGIGASDMHYREVAVCPGCKVETPAEIRCEECRVHKCAECVVIHDDIAICKACIPETVLRIDTEIEWLQARRTALVADSEGVTCC
jgi:hypothetical protein